MSLQGTFNTAVQAMLSQSQFMSNIGTNIANVNTTGYKAQDTHFQTLLNHVQPTDKRFFTVNTFDYRQVEKQGTIATTNRNLDVAINGRGFFVTNSTLDGSAGFQYTRDGAFFGKASTLAVDTDSDGQLDQGTLLTTANGSYVYGWKANDDGTFSQTDSLESLVPIEFNNNSIFPFKSTTHIDLQANLSAADTGRQNVGLPFVDQEGNSRSMTIGFNASITGEWTLDMSSFGLDTQPVDVTFDPPTIMFDGKGRLTSPSEGILNVTVNDAVGPQSFTVDISKMSQFSDEGQLTVVGIDQDGYIEGRLKNSYFTKDGTLVGSYTNGEVKNLYKLPIARFQADHFLEARGGNIFLQTQDAGALMLKGLGDPTGTTEVVSGALENSNVDLTDQFSKMIVTQRAYSSAAKVLTTADEMTMAARDLKR
jgi:flagellar hook protein FlgE